MTASPSPSSLRGTRAASPSSRAVSSTAPLSRVAPFVPRALPRFSTSARVAAALVAITVVGFVTAQAAYPGRSATNDHTSLYMLAATACGLASVFTAIGSAASFIVRRRDADRPRGRWLAFAAVPLSIIATLVAGALFVISLMYIGD